ncbi:MAG: hypothetical protein ACI8XG_002143 [Congregibacter sp.]
MGFFMQYFWRSFLLERKGYINHVQSLILESDNIKHFHCSVV